MIKHLALATLLALPVVAPARTKLVTLPDRSRLVTSLENPRFTLLSEEREIPLAKGTNHIDFAWNGVNVDNRSVMLEFLTHPGAGPEATKIISTSFPPNEAALTWQVYSPEDRTEKVRVSYILFGITQDNSYELRVDASEKQGKFQQYFRLSNQSGENLDNSIVRLPLMEDLTRSVDSGETRRFLAAKNDALPISKLYVSKPGYSYFKGDDGEDVDLVYEIENSAKSGLGKYKLPIGKARIYIDDGMDSSIFLGEDVVKETPAGEKSGLTLGKVKDVVIKRRLLSNERRNIRTNNSKSPVLYDQERTLTYEIENFKEEPVTLRLTEVLNGDWSVKEISDSSIRQEKKSINELNLFIDLPANAKGEKATKKEVTVVFLVKNRFPGEE